MSKKSVTVPLLGIQLAFVLTALMLTPSSSFAQEDNKKTYSAILGFGFGQQLKMQGHILEDDIDIAAFSAAMRSALEGGEPNFEREGANKVLTEVQQKLTDRRNKVAQENLKTGQEFLAKNKSTSGVVVSETGLQRIVITEGSGANPQASDTVKVHYKGTFIDGSSFDSSYDRGVPAEFPLDRVIPGWTEGIQTMKVGGKSRFFIPANLAYGEGGRPGIPGNSVLIFEVELLGITPAKKEDAAK